MPAIATADPGQQPAPLHVATERDQLVDLMARRIRWAQHVGGPGAAVQVAGEFADHIEQAMREARDEGSRG